MRVLGEGALGLPMQQGPVKVVDHWVDVDSPEHERWTHLVHLLHCTEHLVLGMFLQHTEQTQVILVLVFPANVGPGFLSIPAHSSSRRSRPAGMACSSPKKGGTTDRGRPAGHSHGGGGSCPPQMSLVVTMGMALKLVGGRSSLMTFEFC